MRLIIRPDFDEMSEWAARYLKQRINQFAPTESKPFVLGLPTGGTPIGVYEKLRSYHERGELSFKHVVTFNMDEYVGLDKHHEQSYHKFMWENLFKHVDVQPKNVNILNGVPDGYSDDLPLEDKLRLLERECADYEKRITDAGGIELFLGGIGPDGHIAFNEPGSSLVSRTRIKSLCKETIIANKRFFDGNVNLVPTMSLTVGVGTVMDAREVVVLISGQNKAMALFKCIEEGVSHMWTVSAVQQHRKSMIVCDDDATSELKVKTVQYFRGLEEIHNQMLGDMPIENLAEEPTPAAKSKLTPDIKRELMEGIKTLPDGASKWAEISTLTISNEHAMARCFEQSCDLPESERWGEIYQLLVQVKQQPVLAKRHKVRRVSLAQSSGGLSLLLMPLWEACKGLWRRYGMMPILLVLFLVAQRRLLDTMMIMLKQQQKLMSK
jgi:glucosamine-6-phosphate deaminase